MNIVYADNTTTQSQVKINEDVDKYLLLLIILLTGMTVFMKIHVKKIFFFFFYFRRLVKAHDDVTI